MKALIIEDEVLTAERLANIISKHTSLEIAAMLHSVKSSIKWLKSNATPDLIFLDIQLGDGTGFDILDQLDFFPHIIFTTAFDQYAIDAFKYNSVDYLLKPIKPDDLTRALDKLKKIEKNSSLELPNILNELKNSFSRSYRQKFLVKVGLKFHSYQIDEIAYFYSNEGLTYLRHKSGNAAIIDLPLDLLESQLDPTHFFRINRHMIIRSTQIDSIDSYFNSRLILILNPTFHESVIVSRERVKAFKEWLDA